MTLAPKTIEPFLTQEMLSKIARMPAPKRVLAMKTVGREEWARCAEDIFYWVDHRCHLVPYVYTSDKQPPSQCLICGDGEPHAKNKLRAHLQIYHGVGKPTFKDLQKAFKEMSGTRLFPIHLLDAYIAPIYDVLSTEELIAIPKTRTMFATWMIVTYYTWLVLFHRDKQVLFQSENAQKTNELVQRAHSIWKNQPKWIKAISPARFGEGVSKAGKFTVEDLQSEIWGLPQGADKIRQFHPTAVFSDEAAFNPEAAETYAAIRPAIQGGGQYVATSSANSGWFQRICQDTLDQ